MGRRHFGVNNAYWKGGRAIDSRGYELTLKRDHHFAHPNGYVLTHRLVFEQSRDCCVMSWADIHHKDGNILNNVWYNLEGLTRGQHTTITWKGKHRIDMNNRVCSICASNTTYWDEIPNRPRWKYFDNKLVCGRCYGRETYRKKIRKGLRFL